MAENHIYCLYKPKKNLGYSTYRTFLQCFNNFSTKNDDVTRITLYQDQIPLPILVLILPINFINKFRRVETMRVHTKTKGKSIFFNKTIIFVPFKTQVHPS